MTLILILIQTLKTLSHSSLYLTHRPIRHLHLGICHHCEGTSRYHQVLLADHQVFPLEG